MIVFDTNVVSELMRTAPDAKVRAWFAGQRRTTLFTTSITKAEILYGIALLPSGRRKTALADAAERMFAGVFASAPLMIFVILRIATTVGSPVRNVPAKDEVSTGG